MLLGSLLLNAKPFSEAVLNYYKLDLEEHTSINCFTESVYTFSFKKNAFLMSTAKSCPFVQQCTRSHAITIKKIKLIICEYLIDILKNVSETFPKCWTLHGNLTPKLLEPELASLVEVTCNWAHYSWTPRWLAGVTGLDDIINEGTRGQLATRWDSLVGRRCYYI